jgi:flavin-dependent dehydrogenase
MLNYCRNTFDHWLNGLAQDAGATFADETSLNDFTTGDDGIVATLAASSGSSDVSSKYLVAADGFHSAVHKKLRPGDYQQKAQGITLNLNIAVEKMGKLDPNRLVMNYNKDFGQYMFAWIYFKNDTLVVGSGSRDDAQARALAFLEHAKKKYEFTGTIVKKEGFTNLLKSSSGIFLGNGNVLVTGDAANLCDLYRGMGMDNAALSARLVARAILNAEEVGTPAIGPYTKLMAPSIRTITRNAGRDAGICATNEELEKWVKAGLLKTGFGMVFYNQINKVLPPEKMVFCPP